MSGTDFGALSPLLIPAYGGVVLTAAFPFVRRHGFAFWTTLATLAAALASVLVALQYAPAAVTSLIVIDRFSLYFAALVLAGAILVTLQSRDYLAAHSSRPEAYYLLLLMAVVGMEGVACSSHLVSFFLSLEVLSVSLYGLIGYTQRYRFSVEAAVKYLVLAAASAAFLAFGIALVYAEYGTMDLRELAGLASRADLSIVTLFGLALVLVGFGYKLAVAPFHMWSPDVYEGAPAPISGLIASGSKGAVLALLLRVAESGVLAGREVYLAIVIAAAATMVVGNLLALLQPNVKRMLAYSSVAHIGYLLLSVLAGGAVAASSAAFYLVSYFAAVIAAFGVIAALSNQRSGGEVTDVEHYRGLVYSHPGLAAVMTISLLSLTGIPLTSGFFAKLYVFLSAARAGLWELVVLGLVASGVSAYYYLRLLTVMFAREEQDSEVRLTGRGLNRISIYAAAAAVVFFGIWPMPLVELAQSAMRGLGF